MDELARLLTVRTDLAWSEFEPLRDRFHALGEVWTSSSRAQLQAGGTTYLFHATLTDIDPMLRVKVGAFVHQLRASLDNIAWGLARRVRRNPGNVSFPVCRNPRAFRASSLVQVIGAGSRAAAALERLQPYNRAEGRFLTMLHRLWNDDKHRLPPLLAALPAGALIFPYADEPPITFSRAYTSSRGKAVKHDQVIAKVIFASPPEKAPRVRIALHPCLDCPGAPRDRYLPTALWEMHRYVRHEVIPGAAPFL